MSLKNKPVVIMATTKSEKAAKVETFQDGKTWLQFEVTYADDKGTVLNIGPLRDWVGKADSAILTQADAKGLYVVAQRAQAVVAMGQPVEGLNHLLDRPFTVKATPEILEWLAGRATIGGRAQVAYFKAKAAASRATRSKARKVFAKALAEELATS